MTEINWPEAKEISPAAVKCGRIVFCVVGGILFLIPAIFSYSNPSEHVMLAAICMGVAMILTILGLVLPPKIVAHFGFWLPTFLPDD